MTVDEPFEDEKMKLKKWYWDPFYNAQQNCIWDVTVKSADANSGDGGEEGDSSNWGELGANDYEILEVLFCARSSHSIEFQG